MSFIASASCVLRAGATPVFVDVDEHMLMDLDRAHEVIGERTRALITVALHGQMADPIATEAFAREHGLALIEDAAQALGARVGDRAAGSVGLLSCCSFDPTKTVAAPGSGGAVLCDDDVRDRLRRLRWHGKDAAGGFSELGYNSQLPTGVAAVLTDKLALDAEWTARRREVAAAYDAALSGTDLRPVGVAVGRTHVFHKYVVRSRRVGEVRAALASEGIPTLVHYAMPLYRHEVFGPAAARAAAAARCPRAEDVCAEVFSLPIHAYLRDDEIEHVCAVLGSQARAV